MGLGVGLRHTKRARARADTQSTLNPTLPTRWPVSHRPRARPGSGKGEIIIMPCCYDGLTARMVEAAGFDLTFMVHHTLAHAPLHAYTHARERARMHACTRTLPHSQHKCNTCTRVRTSHAQHSAHVTQHTTHLAPNTQHASRTGTHTHTSMAHFKCSSSLPKHDICIFNRLDLASRRSMGCRTPS